MKVEIKRHTDCSVVFSHDCENNSVALTLALAIEAKTSLCNADLCDSDLRYADLCGADLCGADLRDADLRYANLCDSDLRYADLRDSNLCGADLRGANLSCAIGNMRQVFSMQLETWYICYTKDMLFIGCKAFAIDEWRNFNDNEITTMDSKALPLWKKWKSFIMTAIEMTIFE